MELLWHTSEIFHKAERQSPRPTWNGLMDQLISGEKKNSPKSTITKLPPIDLNPRDKGCIYTTLFYIIQQAKHLNIEIPSTNRCELKHLNSQN